MNKEQKISFIGYTDYRNKRVKFGIKEKDRLQHMYVIGKTGMGKSTLLENIAAQDILNGNGMCFIDPHGSAIDTLLDYVPDERVTDVIYFAPFDTQYPISFNVLEDVDPDQRHLVMSGLMATFEKIWPDTFSERMRYILSNTLLALLEFPGATLLGVNRMLADKDYRNAVIENISDASVRAFWVDEFNKWDPRYAREASAAIQNKIGQFTSNPIIRNIVGQEKTSFNLREVMDGKKILLVNLSKGQIGESNANLLGGMLITKLFLAAMSRSELGSARLKELPPFFLFVDEFQNFANRSFADILSEARKYKLGLTIAHQYIDQMDEAVAAAVFGNVGSIISFRVGAADAEVLEKQFAPVFTAEDIVNLGKFQIYLTLMIDGVGSRPFSATTLPPLEKPAVSLRNEVIANSRYWYTSLRPEVEARIRAWYEKSFKKVERRHIADPEELREKKSFFVPKKERIVSKSEDREEEQKESEGVVTSKKGKNEGKRKKAIVKKEKVSSQEWDAYLVPESLREDPILKEIRKEVRESVGTISSGEDKRGSSYSTQVSLEEEVQEDGGFRRRGSSSHKEGGRKEQFEMGIEEGTEVQMEEIVSPKLRELLEALDSEQKVVEFQKRVENQKEEKKEIRKGEINSSSLQGTKEKVPREKKISFPRKAGKESMDELAAVIRSIQAKQKGSAGGGKRGRGDSPKNPSEDTLRDILMDTDLQL